jgi:hypothetical protein
MYMVMKHLYSYICKMSPFSLVQKYHSFQNLLNRIMFKNFTNFLGFLDVLYEGKIVFSSSEMTNFEYFVILVTF